MPRIEGVETFEGQSCHTARWPKEPVRFACQRVAVIGTGATGVPSIGLLGVGLAARGLLRRRR